MMICKGSPHGLLYITTQTIPRISFLDLKGYRLEACHGGWTTEWTLYTANTPGGREEEVACSIHADSQPNMGLLIDIGGVVIHNSLNKNVTSTKAEWIVVPADPTEPMLLAGSKAEVGVLEHIDGEALRFQGKVKSKMSKVALGDEPLRRVWKAMIKGYTG